MANNDKLTSSDVTRLLQDPSDENRASAAERVASTFGLDDLSEQERALAEDIFRVMLKDAAVRVRQALSESLKDNPDVPHDVALSLAKDVDAVALPVVESSSVLSEADLVSLVKTRSSGVRKAVAGREDVTESVADALVDSRDEAAVATLVGNEKARISEATFGKVLREFADSEQVTTPMAYRGDLPIAVSEQLVTLVTDSLRDHIMAHNAISPDVAAELMLESREKATVSLLKGGHDTQTVKDLVNQLYDNDRLTPTLIIRALCMGDTTFFETALARRAEIPVMNAYRLISEHGDRGLERLMEKANIPIQFYEVARAALGLARETIATSGDSKEQFKQLMIERVLTALEDNVDTENLDYLIGKLRRINDREGAVS
ncbi:DUF2336 domain-containing protein [Yunchengibacter salinarum]|uniref:DUF2336 domain-containing protein n=1 Tax=Yunchengibacter salinarum TaxID=3133399 RepID=UPI0035B61172